MQAGAVSRACDMSPETPAQPPAAARELPDLVLEVLERDCRPAKLPPVKRESEEGALPDRRHAALVLVDRKLELPAQVPGQTRHDALACADTLHQHQKVVGIAHEAMPPPLQFPVQIV